MASGDTIKINDGEHNLGYVHENVLEARGLAWQPSSCHEPVGDHEHCLICWWALHESPDDRRNRGYRDGDRWLCVECHSRFIVNNELNIETA